MSVILHVSGAQALVQIVPWVVRARWVCGCVFKAPRSRSRSRSALVTPRESHGRVPGCTIDGTHLWREPHLERIGQIEGQGVIAEQVGMRHRAVGGRTVRLVRERLVWTCARARSCAFCAISRIRRVWCDCERDLRARGRESRKVA